MTHLPGPSTDHLASPHTAHDTILVAALAAGDLADLAMADAEALVAACAECADLRADLHAIAAATRALPAPVRTRDFRLTPAQAERLRPSRPRRLLAAFASPRFAASRPLAVAFTTLGLAGLLLTAIPAGGPTALFSGAAGERAGSAAQGPTTQIDGSGSPSPLVPEVRPQAGEGNALGPKATGASGDRDTASNDAAPAPGPAPWLLVLSLSLLSVGLGLFAAGHLRRPD